MPDPTVRLLVLPVSPYSERARWALDHHRIVYRTSVHVPFLGERRLRRLVGPGKARATVPVLTGGHLAPGEVLGESWDIALYADRHGGSTPLVPSERASEVRRYNDLADRTMEAGRLLVTRALLASPEALRETFPPDMPSWLRGVLLPVTRFGTAWFGRKYAVRLDDAAAALTTLRATFVSLRESLAQSSPYLLGSFSYADIVMAVLLQAVVPVPSRFIPLGAATRRVWTQPALAAEFSDLVAWRDTLYERHRLPAQSVDVAAGATA